MWKKALLGTLAVILIAAVGFSIYNVITAQASTAPAGTAEAAIPAAAEPAVPGGAAAAAASGAPAVQNQNGAPSAGPASGAGPGAQAGAGLGQGQRGGPSQQRGPGAGMNVGAAGSQSGLTDWQTLEGTVSGLAAPNFTLVTADGESIPVQLGNLSYVNKIGLSLVDGQAVTLVGAYEAGGSLAVQSITVDGQAYDLRDATGRPLWAGRGAK